MLRVYIIRHGETEPNTRFACVGRSDVPLNETGIIQAQKLAERLECVPDTIFVSPLCRAIDTIKPYLDKHSDIPCFISPLLIERDFGIWENLSFKEIEETDPERFNEWQDNYIEYVIPHGESLMEVQHRVEKFLAELYQKYDNKTVFIVTHLCTARHLISTLLGLDPEMSRRFTMKNGYYAVIDYDNIAGYGVIKYLNV